MRKIVKNPNELLKNSGKQSKDFYYEEDEEIVEISDSTSKKISFDKQMDEEGEIVIIFHSDLNQKGKPKIASKSGRTVYEKITGDPF